MIKNHDCIFCKIVKKNHQAESIIFENDEVLVFEDIKPASTFHYLAVPVNHKRNIKFLSRSDIPLLKEMYQQGLKCMELNGANIKDCRIGFHWSPFNSVDHLHLHFISPISLIKKCFFFNKYSPDSIWFKTYEWSIKYLEKRGVMQI